MNRDLEQPSVVLILQFDARLRSNTPRLGHWLDSSALSVEQTVDEAQRHWAEAWITP